MKQIFKIALVAVLAISMVSCYSDKRNPNVRYMADTDMYNAVSYETYGTNPNYKDGIDAQAPVAGTIFRGEVPYEIQDNEAGYNTAKASLVSPLEVNGENLINGKALYTIYCAVCHADKGDGQGILAKREKFLGIPNFKDRDITDGSIYHVIMYGRNMMGSHASQLKNKERWQVVQYVQKLRTDLLQ